MLRTLFLYLFLFLFDPSSRTVLLSMPCFLHSARLYLSPNKSFFSVHSSTFYANHQRQQQQNTQIRNNEIKAENRWFCHTSILFSQRWNYQFIYIALYVVISTRMHWNYIHFHYSKFYCCCWMAAFFLCATVIVRVEESER